MRVNLHSDLIEVSLVADQRTNGKTHSTSMVYRPPSEPQVLIARFLILVKEKNTMSDGDLKVDSVNEYGSNNPMYYVAYSKPVGEPVPYQFHSQQCMMEFLQRADIIRQILPIITANRHAPIIPAKKPRKKPQRKIDLPDYNAMEKRILGLI